MKAEEEKKFLSRVALSHVTDGHVLIDDREWSHRNWKRKQFPNPFCRYFYERSLGVFYEWVLVGSKFRQRQIEDRRLIDLLKMAAFPFTDWK